MRRRPEEHDQEKPERGQGEAPRRGGVADEGRHRAGGATEHDVRGPPPLEVARVDHDVEEIAGERERRCREVDRRCEHRERARGERDPELERARRGQPAGGDRSPRGARPHEPVDVSIEHVIERACTAAGEGETEQHKAEPPRIRRSARPDDHPARSSDEQERHDPRLRQGEVVASAPARDLPAAERRGREHGGRGKGERGEREVERARRRGGRRKEECERGDSRRQQAPVCPGSSDDERDERRQRDRCDRAMCRASARAAHDRRGARARGAEGRQPE